MMNGKNGSSFGWRKKIRKSLKSASKTVLYMEELISSDLIPLLRNEGGGDK
jgi:hypothetical protein